VGYPDASGTYSQSTPPRKSKRFLRKNRRAGNAGAADVS
jgi:hypothetical protein